MSRPIDPERVLHSFMDDGPANMAFHVQASIGDEVLRTRQRGRPRGGGRNALRTRLRMTWPAAVLAMVIVIAAAGGAIAPDEASTAPTSLPATAAPVAPVALGPAPVPAMALDSAPASSDRADTSLAIAPVTANANGAEAPWIVYVSGDRIHLVRQDGSQEHVILADIGLRQRGAAWSRDGRLAFEADFGVASQLWVASPEGDTASPLTDIDLACSSACAFAVDATWSGDGSAIAYVRRTVARGAVTSNELVVVTLADRVSRTLVIDDRHLLRRPSWEPGGQRIVVERDSGPGAMRGKPATTQLVTVDTRDASPALTRVPGTGSDAHDPTWGGNGLVAYATTRAGDPTDPGAGAGSALVVVDPDSGLSLTVLAFPAGVARVTDPAWWPNGEGLLYGRLAPHAVVPVVRTVDLATRLDQSATGAETAVGFDPDLRRSAP